jgi:hypothetical protein
MVGAKQSEISSNKSADAFVNGLSHRKKVVEVLDHFEL